VEAAPFASTNCGEAVAKTAVVAVSASTSGRGASTNTVERSRARQLETERERRGRGGMRKERVGMGHENSAEGSLGVCRACGRKEQVKYLKTSESDEEGCMSLDLADLQRTPRDQCVRAIVRTLACVRVCMCVRVCVSRFLPPSFSFFFLVCLSLCFFVLPFSLSHTLSFNVSLSLCLCISVFLRLCFFVFLCLIVFVSLCLYVFVSLCL